MKVIKPIPITDSNFVSSTAAEAPTAWNSGTTYTANQTVSYLHRIYSAARTTTNENPATVAAAWTDTGPTNRWAMFDSQVSTVTSLTSPLTFVVAPGYASCAGLFGLVGSSVEITVRDGLAGPIVYNDTFSLDGTLITDWYQYFFEPTIQLPEIVTCDLPPYLAGHITVSITGTGTVSCGVAAFGNSYDLGDTQLGATVGIIDYSRKTTASDGTTTFAQGKFSSRVSASSWVENGQLNKVKHVLEALRATPCVWVGTDAAGYEPLTVFGFYRDFSIDVSYPTVSLCNLEIEGLT